MKVIWDELGTEGLEGGFEGICAFGTKGVPLLISFHVRKHECQVKHAGKTHFGLVIQLCAFLFDTLCHSGGKLWVQTWYHYRKSRTRFNLHTLSCSSTASDTHFTLASRARTSTAFRADVDDSWLARKQSCSPCCSAFLDCTTKETRWGLSVLSRCADI